MNQLLWLSINIVLDSSIVLLLRKTMHIYANQMVHMKAAGSFGISGQRQICLAYASTYAALYENT